MRLVSVRLTASARSSARLLVRRTVWITFWAAGSVWSIDFTSCSTFSAVAAGASTTSVRSFPPTLTIRRTAGSGLAICLA